MSLEKLKVNKKQRESLANRGFTLQRLASSSPGKLKNIPGIGAKSATTIIKQAQELVNQKGLEDSQTVQGPAPPAPSMGEENWPPQMSARVRRILARAKQEEEG